MKLHEKISCNLGEFCRPTLTFTLKSFLSHPMWFIRTAWFWQRWRFAELSSVFKTCGRVRGDETSLHSNCSQSTMMCACLCWCAEIWSEWLGLSCCVSVNRISRSPVHSVSSMSVVLEEAELEQPSVSVSPPVSINRKSSTSLTFIWKKDKKK